MSKRIGMLLLATLVVASFVARSQDQRRDKGVFIEPRNAFIDSINASLERFRKEEKPAKKEFKVDFAGIAAPTSVDQFTSYWHAKPVSQGLSGMCWCFSTTSYFESEIYRLTKRTIRLSELYTVYWEYVEKARRYVRERGESEFGQGSESNAVSRIWKQYGIVPADAYTGLLNGQPFHDHDKMFDEMNTYLKSLKTSNAWDEDAVLKTIRSILDHYIGAPPQTVKVEGKTMTPQEYFEKVVRLNLDDYVEVMSLMQQPFYKKVEYEVGDNWWHSKDYFNVPVNDFIAVIKDALRKGQTICIGGDTSEPGHSGNAGIAVVPTFDIPSAYIDDLARQMRFSNKTTGDDHGIHIVGYLEKDGKDWYLVKDSGSGSRNNSHPGYMFFHEDFVKLKMLTLTVHKDILHEVVKQY